MRNLLETPSVFSSEAIVDSADWVEINALFREGDVSSEDLAKAFVRGGEKPPQAGGNQIGERARRVAEDAFKELANRETACGPAVSTRSINKYPFILNQKGSLLSVRSKSRARSEFELVYLFLLVLTRADLGSQARRLKGIDPTQIFEQLCGDVLCNFWGGKSDYSGSLVFGTAGKQTGTGKAFKDRVNNLCALLAEGSTWNPEAEPPNSGDRKLDVVAWRRFSDGRPGGLIGFAQCKTGIHWDEHLTELQPQTFTRTFMKPPLIIDPVRFYMVPCRVEGGQAWNEHTSNGGILLDRCRITHYAQRIKSSVLDDCEKWMNAALKQQEQGRFKL